MQQLWVTYANASTPNATSSISFWLNLHLCNSGCRVFDACVQLQPRTIRQQLHFDHALPTSHRQHQPQQSTHGQQSESNPATATGSQPQAEAAQLRPIPTQISSGTGGNNAACCNAITLAARGVGETSLGLAPLVHKTSGCCCMSLTCCSGCMSLPLQAPTTGMFHNPDCTMQVLVQGLCKSACWELLLQMKQTCLHPKPAMRSYQAAMTVHHPLQGCTVSQAQLLKSSLSTTTGWWAGFQGHCQCRLWVYSATCCPQG